MQSSLELPLLGGYGPPCTCMYYEGIDNRYTQRLETEQLTDSIHFSLGCLYIHMYKIWKYPALGIFLYFDALKFLGVYPPGMKLYIYKICAQHSTEIQVSSCPRQRFTIICANCKNLPATEMHQQKLVEMHSVKSIVKLVV